MDMFELLLWHHCWQCPCACTCNFALSLQETLLLLAARWQHNASSPAGCTACWCMWHHAQQAGAPSQTLIVCAFLCGGLLLLVLAGCSFGCNPLFRAYCIVKGRVSAAPVYCAVWWVQCVPAIAASACMPNEWLPGCGCRHVGSGRCTFTGFKVQQPAYTVTT